MSYQLNHLRSNVNLRELVTVFSKELYRVRIAYENVLKKQSV